MRMPRLRGDGTSYYHIVSRVIERQMLLDDVEKERFRKLMRRVEGVSGCRVLTYSCLTNHFHILLEVPEREELTEEETLARVACLYTTEQVELLELQLETLHQHGSECDVETLLWWYQRRMYDISEFMRTLLLRYTVSYTRRHDRRGTLWEDRFKSVLIQPPRKRSSNGQGMGHALTMMAAYIDLNPVRAGLVKDPKDYRYCGYAEAVAGVESARKALDTIVLGLGQESGKDAHSRYRVFLHLQGEAHLSKSGQRVFTRDEVEAELNRGGKLSRATLLRCRVRYFSDGVVLGGQEFVEDIYTRYRERFGRRRKTGARPMKHGEWGGLCTMRDLRLQTVSPSPGT
jgi:putative transposase